jgi:hypothetical protein
MVKLKNEPRPAGQSQDYRFVKNEESGRAFKAKHELRTSSGGRPAIAVSISPVDAEGHALPNPAGDPDIRWHVHEFTAVELEDPNFDVEARIASILSSSVEAKENDLAAQDKIAGLSDKWRGKAALKLDQTAEQASAPAAIAAPPLKK